MVPKRRPAAFVIPFIAVGVGTRLQVEPTSTNRLAFGLALVLGLGAGILWQVLDRRDVVNRLRFPAVALLAGLVVFAGLGVGTLSTDVLASGACMAAGLVLTELWWRRQDEKATETTRHTVHQA